MKKLKNDKGVAIMTVLFFLVIVTIMAVGAITLATVQVRVSGGMVLMEQRRAAAEGTLYSFYPLVQDVVYAGSWKPTINNSYTPFVQTGTNPSFTDKLRDPAFWNLDDKVDNSSERNINNFVINGFTNAVDIDVLGSATGSGGSIEASRGYSAPANVLQGFQFTVLNGRQRICQVIWLPLMY
jgi:hypothetical protein